MSRLSKNVLIYLVGNIVNRFMGIIVLFIATHILSNRKDIGYFTFVNNTANILLTIFCLQIWMGIIRFVFDYKNTKDKLRIISTGYFIGLISFFSFTLVLIIYCFIKNYTIWFFLEIFFLSFSYVFNQIVQFTCRGLLKNKLYVISGIVGSFMQVVVSVLLLFVFKLTYDALIIATAFSYFSQGFFIEFFLNSLKRIKLKYVSLKIVRKMIRFSIPTTMNSIAYCFNQTAYTWFLKFFYDNSAIGAFAPACRMMSLVGLFVMSFNFAFQEYSFLMNKSKFKNKIYNKTFTYFFKFITSGTILLLPITSIFFPIMVGSSYESAKFLIPILYLASILDSLQIFLGSVLQAEKKVSMMFFTQLIGVLITIITMFLTANLMGIESAAIAMALCFFVVFILRFVFVKIRVKLKLQPQFLLHLVPVYILSSIIFLKYNFIVNFLYLILTFFYFVLCNKVLIIKSILKFTRKKQKLQETKKI